MKTLRILIILSLLLPTHNASAELIAFYDFEGDTQDRTANALHGVINGNVTLAPGFVGQAYNFAGTSNDFIQLPIDINPGTLPQLTMGAWVNTNISGGSAGSSAPKVLSHDNGGFDRTIGIDFRTGSATNTTSNWSAFAGPSLGVLRSGQPVATGNWVFIAGVYDQDAGTVTMYIDDQSASTNSAFLGSSTLNAVIGKNAGFGSNEAWNGLIDNVFFYDHALSFSEIEAIRLDPSSILTPVPVPAALWLFGTAMMALGLSRRKMRYGK